MTDTAPFEPRANVGAKRVRGTWRTFDATDGLVAGVWSLWQDTRGHLWMGTRAGLVRYDGSEFLTYTVAEGLAGDEVMALCEAQGKLWIGTRTGLSSYDGETFTTFAAEGDLPATEIADLYCDSRDRVWIATHGGVACLDAGRLETLGTLEGLLTNETRRVYEDRRGRIWFATIAGLSRYEDGAFRHYTRDDGLPAAHVLSLLEDRNGRLWIGTLAGLAWYQNGEIGRLRPAGGQEVINIRAIHEDRQGRVWFGSIGQGLFCWDGEALSEYHIDDGLLGEHVTSIVEDSEGHLWIGDGLSGLTCFHAETIEHLSDEGVTEDLRQDAAGRLWFASGNHLCCLADGQVRRRRFDCRLFGLLIDEVNRLWVATWGEGLYRFDDPARVFETEPVRFTTDDGLASNFIAGLLQTRAGEILAGSGYPGCLCRYRDENFDAIDLPQKVVFRLLEDSEGRIWTGGFSTGGLVCYHQGEITAYGTNDGLPSDAVQSLVEDSRGDLWIGTRQGVARFDHEQFTCYGRETGFLTLDNQVSARDAAGQIWLGTKCGVYRRSADHLQVLTQHDGLPGNTVTSLVPQPDGSMIVGTFHGIVRYRPTATRPPLIDIREVAADQEFSAPRAVTLTASGAALVTVSFRGLGLGTHRMRYSYRLTGYDDAWRETWETQVRYRHLPVGEYTFEVIAINRDLVASESPAQVAVTVVIDPWREQQAEYEAEINRISQLLALHQRSTRQNRALVELARSEGISRGELTAAFRQVVRIASRTLSADRAAIWWVTESAGHLEQRIGYERALDVYHSGAAVSSEAFPCYSDTLEETRVIGVTNLAEDRRTRELQRDDLGPLDVLAIMIAPVRLAGRVRAILCIDHVAEEREWTVDEQQFAASLADLVALAVEAHERREAEARVAYQAHLLDEVSDAIVAVDRGRRITSWNRAAEVMYGWEEREVVGRPFEEIIPSEVTDLTVDEFWARLLREGNWHGEAIHGTRDGRQLQVEWSLALIREVDRAASGAVAVIHDITARKEAEAEQQRLQLQVQHAQKLESLGVLAGGIAHDFNNLLMGILGNAGLALIELSPDSPARHSVEQIELASQRAAELTRQMLAYSGKGQLEVRPVNLTRLVREMAHLLEVSISKKAVLHYEFDDQLPACLGDATQLRQVVMNLITNASDSLGEEPGVVAVRTATIQAERRYLRETYVDDQLPAGPYVYVEVTDTGIGMSEATRSRIFEPFFTTKFTGRGLGLAAVLGIVRGHGGAIQVASRETVGTTFTVLFPAVEAIESEIETAATNEPTWDGAGTVLVVDDEESVRNVVQRTLQQFGFEVELACDGIEAIEAFSRQPDSFALVILDLTMPRLDGAECYHRLRQIREDIRVLMTSGFNEQDTLTRFGEGRPTQFLQKPYGPRALLQKVRETLGE